MGCSEMGFDLHPSTEQKACGTFSTAATGPDLTQREKQTENHIFRKPLYVYPVSLSFPSCLIAAFASQILSPSLHLVWTLRVITLVDIRTVLEDAFTN